jgi:hypothetical protein
LRRQFKLDGPVSAVTASARRWEKNRRDRAGDALGEVLVMFGQGYTIRRGRVVMLPSASAAEADKQMGLALSRERKRQRRHGALTGKERQEPLAERLTEARRLLRTIERQYPDVIPWAMGYYDEDEGLSATERNRVLARVRKQLERLRGRLEHDGRQRRAPVVRAVSVIRPDIHTRFQAIYERVMRRPLE